MVRRYYYIGEQKFTCTLKNLASRFVLSMEYITRWRGFRNDSMDALLSRHLPIITNRLEFFPTNIGPPPVITSTIDFANRLAIKKRNAPATEDLDNPVSTSLHDDNSDMDTNESPAIVPTIPPTPTDVDSNSEGDFLDTVDKKIPKPRGQPGHPRCGGYSLDFVLRRWGSTLIADVTVSNRILRSKSILAHSR